MNAIDVDRPHQTQSHVRRCRRDSGCQWQCFVEGGDVVLVDRADRSKATPREAYDPAVSSSQWEVEHVLTAGTRGASDT